MLQWWRTRVLAEIRPSLRPFVLPVWAALAILVVTSFISVGANETPAEAAPTETSERAVLIQDVKTLFEANDFAALETMAAQFRASRERTRSGIWKLSVFYRALHEATLIERDDNRAWARISARLRAWLAAYPKSPTPIVANGIVLKRYAWVQRPRFLLMEISAPSEDRFVSTLKMARNYLEANQELAGQDPHYYVVLSDLASALGEDAGRFYTMIEAGLAKEPEYYPLYFAGLDYFAPVGADGSKRSVFRNLAAYANTMVERTAQAEGSSIYARLYWHATQAGYGDQLVGPSGFSWDRVAKGIDDVLAKYPDRWNAENFARLACLSGDRAKARALIAKVTSPPDLKIWRSQAAYEACKQQG
jgi:Domain of unknown function (DUF4034)